MAIRTTSSRSSFGTMPLLVLPRRREPGPRPASAGRRVALRSSPARGGGLALARRRGRHVLASDLRPCPSPPYFLLPGRKGPGVGRFPHIQMPRPKPADPPPTPPFQGGEQCGGYPNHFEPIVERRYAPPCSAGKGGARPEWLLMQDGGCLAILPRQGEVAGSCLTEGEVRETSVPCPPPPTPLAAPPPGGGGSFQSSLRT